MSTSVLPSMRIDGQVALVTGAGRGIGKGCAVALAEAGAEVIAMSRTKAELDQVVADIESAGGVASAVVCDVSDAISVQEEISKLDR
ncbi:MAG: SDR family NAD(P)-dependent oxidoreductase, partial [Actinomycetota bacterium]|nr:SDR family NAD(P)-dependent oxidoreductase [Actinomycetota bacterium]